ncbi:MAG: Mut7-C RNAse domain-containing protein [Acidimicrobiia bacterium]|nr:Mut7-C RNAse domain-containing protein [Acidimicrobiia bacterium]
MPRSTASFRFYAELNDFLPAANNSGLVIREFDESPSVKDQIEACGVPHTEVDLVLANGESVGFSYRLCDGDEIGVYPVFESFDIAAVSKVRPEPLREMRFVVDINLGKLARYLRLLGFDALSDGQLRDTDLVAISVDEQRILLTKDRPLLKRSAVTHGYFVRAVHPEDQVVEVVRRFDLSRLIEPFARCLECNGLIEPVGKNEIEHLLEPLTKRYFDEFRRCPGCGRIFWRGSHHERLAVLVETVRSVAMPSPPDA